ncbi:hypothetical protein IIA16_05320 [bacterium]|nr:hypothetical protein [bacterium]
MIPPLAAVGAGDVGVTWLFAGVLGLLIAALALEEKIHAKKSVITASFAIFSLLLGQALGILPQGAVTLPGGHLVNLPVYIPPVDWEVLSIVLGTAIFVEVTTQSGLYNWIALRLTRMSRGDPSRLLWIYGAMTVLFSAVLSNVTAMVIVGSLTVVSLERLKRRDMLLGFLLVEALLTNVGGLLTLISSIPNIIIGQAAGIGFVDFLLFSAPYVLVASVITIIMGSRLFGIRPLQSDEGRERAAKQVAAFLPDDAIRNRALFRISAVALGLLVLAFSLAGTVPVLKDLGLGFVALAFGGAMLWAEKATADRVYSSLDWDLLGFFAGLFVVIGVAEHAGVLDALAGGISALLAMGEQAGSAMLLMASAVASSVTDNVPLAAVLSRVLESRGVPGDDPAWWAVIFGANLGGNLTPIGSASTLLAVAIAHRQGIKLGFAKFVSLAWRFALVQLLLAVGYLLLFA